MRMKASMPESDRVQAVSLRVELEYVSRNNMFSDFYPWWELESGFGEGFIHPYVNYPRAQGVSG